MDRSKMLASLSMFLGSGDLLRGDNEDDECLIAGAQNREALAGLRTFLTDDVITSNNASICACVEGPPLSGKSRCCEVVFRTLRAFVDRWEGLSCGKHKGAAAPTVGVDAYMLKDQQGQQGNRESEGGGGSLPRVLFVDNLHVLIKEDKNSFQNLLKCVRAASAAADKMTAAVPKPTKRRAPSAKTTTKRDPHIKKVVVTLDPSKLDPRIYTKLRAATPRMTQLRLAYPSREETAEFLGTMLHISSVEKDVMPFLKEGESVRSGASRVLRVMETGGEEEEREDEKEEEDAASPEVAAACDVLTSSDLDFTDPRALSFIPSLSSGLSAACVFDGSFEASRAQQIDVARSLLDTAHRYSVKKN